MIAAELDYRAEADPERWPIWIGRSAILGLNGRRFPTDPEDPPVDPRDRLSPERRRVYDLIEAASDGISGPELQLLLEWDQQAVHLQLRHLKRMQLIYGEREIGGRGNRKRYRAK